MATARPVAVGVLLLTALLCPLWAAEARTAIVKAGEGWRLEVDGKPYEAKGVTFSGSGGPANFDADCERLSALGVNTLRTWGTGEEAAALPVPVRLAVQGVEQEGTVAWARVAFEVTAPAGTLLDVSFAYNFRGAATREERDRVTPLESRKGTAPGTWRVRLPSVTGPFKLYGLAKDGAGNLVAATTSVAATAAP